MVKLFSEFLRNLSEFFQEEHRQRLAIIFLSSLLFVCVLTSMVRSTARQRSEADDTASSPPPTAPAPTQTKWWLRNRPSEMPTNLVSNRQTPVGGTTALAISSNCPAYVSISSQERLPTSLCFLLIKTMSAPEQERITLLSGFIEIGDWVKILAEPVCCQ